MPSVVSTGILGLQQRMLSLELQYADPMPLLERLQRLTAFPFEVEQHDRGSIIVRLRDPEDGPAR